MTDATTTQAGTPTAPAVAAPVPGSAEYNAAMIAKADGVATAPAATTPAAAEPAPILGKFKTQDDLIKAYTELEKKLGTPAPATEAPKPAEGTPAVKPLSITPEQQAAESVVQGAGMDFAKLATEFAENGDLKAETYAALDKAGIPKAMVDGYVAGQRALAEAYTSKAHAEAGGEQQFTQMSQWAAKALAPAEIAAYNAAVESGNEAQMRLAVSGLKARFTSQFGTQGTLTQGGNAPAVSAFQSTAQMTEAMRDPRYAKDPAYRADVARRIDANPNLFGVQEIKGVR